MISHAQAFRDTPFGRVLINAPSSIAPFMLDPVIGKLLTRNPHLELEIVSNGSEPADDTGWTCRQVILPT